MDTKEHKLDARGLNCPLPILRVKKKLNDMSSGETLRVIATDPGSVKDFASFCAQTKNELLESSEENREYIFVIMYWTPFIRHESCIRKW